MARSTNDNPRPSEVTIDVCHGLEIKLPAKEWQKLRKADWFAPTRRAMASLPWDTDDWTVGGTRTQPAAVASMLTMLVKLLDNRTPPPTVVPTWRGGVQVEWHRKNLDLEIEADPQGQIEYFFSGPDEEREGRACDDIGRLVEYARAVLASE